MLKRIKGTAFLFLVLSAQLAQAWTPPSLTPPKGAPECLRGFNQMGIDNDRVLKFKVTTPNQYLDRGYVRGPIVEIYPDKNGHDHFAVQIGPNPKDRLEIIYNQAFGALPALQLGQDLVGCGDYITSIAYANPYPPSPDGAILHWVHINPKRKGHESGFLMIDGVVYGLRDPEFQAPRHLDFSAPANP